MSSKEITLNFRSSDGELQSVQARVGDSIMEVAVNNDIDAIVAECGGNLVCATCHCYLDKETWDVVEPPEEAELDMLEGAAAEVREGRSRLSCQVRVSETMDGHTIETPATQ